MMCNGERGRTAAVGECLWVDMLITAHLRNVPFQKFCKLIWATRGTCLGGGSERNLCLPAGRTCRVIHWLTFQQCFDSGVRTFHFFPGQREKPQRLRWGDILRTYLLLFCVLIFCSFMISVPFCPLPLPFICVLQNCLLLNYNFSIRKCHWLRNLTLIFTTFLHPFTWSSV